MAPPRGKARDYRGSIYTFQILHYRPKKTGSKRLSKGKSAGKRGIGKVKHVFVPDGRAVVTVEVMTVVKESLTFRSTP